jgi:hypothetical protein
MSVEEEIDGNKILAEALVAQVKIWFTDFVFIIVNISTNSYAAIIDQFQFQFIDCHYQLITFPCINPSYVLFKYCIHIITIIIVIICIYCRDSFCTVQLLL